jgi:hypothetical protein
MIVSFIADRFSQGMKVGASGDALRWGQERVPQRLKPLNSECERHG